MSPTLTDVDRDPPTERHGVLEGVTTAHTPATLSLQHLHSISTTLAPLRAAYTSAAVDRLRGLPAETRRTLLPHVLAEHPELASEPRIRALAREVELDVEALVDRPDVIRWLEALSGRRAATASEALARAEHALLTMSHALAGLSRARGEFLGTPDDDDGGASLMQALEGTLAAEAPGQLLHAVVRAAHTAAERVATDLAAIERDAARSRWWPAPFRAAALWARASAEQAQKASFADVFRAVLAAQLERG